MQSLKKTSTQKKINPQSNLSSQEVYSPKKYYIKTLGCQANEADSHTLAGVLETLGFEPLQEPDQAKNEKEALLQILPQADIFIVNTCSVRQKSEDKVYGLGKVFKELREEGKKTPFTIMAGCMVGSVTGERQRYAFEELQKKTPWVDLYMNPSQVFDFPNLLHKARILNDWAVAKLGEVNFLPKQKEPKRGFVNISYGCDNFCTFCVVPYARGHEKSRSELEIITEIKHLTLRGVSEITLCGQNVNSWGLSMTEKFEIRTGSEQKLPFAELLRKIHKIPELKKIDFISSNPFDFTSDLIEAIKLPKISDYLHMAVQSGNNEILKKMNRRHTIEDFYNLVDRIKQAKPEVEFGTDLIVGFPGETEEQFLNTLELVKKVKFNVAYIAMYSPRKGTPAERFYSDDIPLREKKRRHALLTKTWRNSLSNH